MKCSIKWVDKCGDATPDQNTAVVMVRSREHYVSFADGRRVLISDSPWYPCCAEHAKQLSEPGMQDWESKPIDPPALTPAQLDAIALLWDATDSFAYEYPDVATRKLIAARDAMGRAFPADHPIYGKMAFATND